MGGEFIIPLVVIDNQFPRIGVLGIKRILDELHLFVQIFIMQLQASKQIVVLLVIFTQQTVELLKVDVALTVGYLSELLHQRLLSYDLTEHVVGLRVD